MRPIPKPFLTPRDIEEQNKSKARKIWEKIRDFLIWLFAAIVAGISALLG